MKKILLCANGLYHDAKAWNTIIENVDFDQVIKFDFPNQTRSNLDPTFNKYTQLTQFLRDEIRKSGAEIENITAVGFSAGANLIRYLHCIEKMHFREMLLISPNVIKSRIYYAQVLDSLKRLVKKCGIDGFSHASMYMNFAPEFFMRMEGLNHILANQFRITYEESVGSLYALMDIFLDEPTLDSPPVNFHSPVHFMFGSADPQSPVNYREEYLKNCTGEFESSIIDCGHSIVFERPKEIINRLRIMRENA